MPAKRYRVNLTDEERNDLIGLVSKGKGSARRLRRARILLLADETVEDGAGKMRLWLKPCLQVPEELSEYAKTV